MCYHRSGRALESDSYCFCWDRGTNSLPYNKRSLFESQSTARLSDLWDCVSGSFRRDFLYRYMHFPQIASAACNSSSIESHASHTSHTSHKRHTVVLIPSDAAGFYTVEMYPYMYRTAVPCRTCGYMVSVPVLAKG